MENVVEIKFKILNLDWLFNDTIRMIFDPKNKSDHIVLDAKKNYFSIFETDLYEKKLKYSSTYFITSESCLFIPIMLSFNYKNNCLSVEHTHPPTEYFFGAQKLKIANLIKKEWL